MRIVVPGEMPGMNEIVAKAKQHFGGYSNMKRKYTMAVKVAAFGLPSVDRAIVRCHWYVKDKRRDPDNIEAAVKFILDGLVMAGVLPGDGWQHVAGIEHSFAVDKNNPRVEVEVEAA